MIYLRRERMLLLPSKKLSFGSIIGHLIFFLPRFKKYNINIF